MLDLDLSEALVDLGDLVVDRGALFQQLRELGTQLSDGRESDGMWHDCALQRGHYAQAGTPASLILIKA